MEDLAIKKKALDADGALYLKEQIEKYMKTSGKRDIESIFPMVVNYVFSMGFYEGIAECIKILRERD